MNIFMYPTELHKKLVFLFNVYRVGTREKKFRRLLKHIEKTWVNDYYPKNCETLYKDIINGTVSFVQAHDVLVYQLNFDHQETKDILDKLYRAMIATYKEQEKFPDKECFINVELPEID